jgi:hypothetical protein
MTWTPAGILMVQSRPRDQRTPLSQTNLIGRKHVIVFKPNPDLFPVPKTRAIGYKELYYLTQSGQLEAPLRVQTLSQAQLALRPDSGKPTKRRK